MDILIRINQRLSQEEPEVWRMCDCHCLAISEINKKIPLSLPPVVDSLTLMVDSMSISETINDKFSTIKSCNFFKPGLFHTSHS